MVAASLVGSRAVSVKPAVKPAGAAVKLVNRRIEIHRVLALAKPVTRRIEQLHRMVVVTNSSGGRKERPSGDGDDGQT